MEAVSAKDAAIGKQYKTVGGCLVTVTRMISRAGGSVFSVVLEDEGKEVFVNPLTPLIPIEQSSEAIESQSEEVFSKKSSLTSVINPMLLSGKYTAEEIADKVIQTFSEESFDREKLIKQIKGPRLYYLTQQAKKRGTSLPSLRKDK